MATIRKRKRFVVRNSKSADARRRSKKSAAKHPRASERRRHLPETRKLENVKSKKIYRNSSQHAAKRKPQYRAIEAHAARKAGGADKRLKKQNVLLHHSLEELLEDRVFERKVNILNAPLMHDILYSATPTLRDLAYKSGFSFGRELYAKSDGTVNKLLETLEFAGLNNVLYYPFEDKIMITAIPGDKQSIGKGMHVYESGIIAGYLSATSKKMINVVETESGMPNGSRCQFIAKPEGAFRIGNYYTSYDLKNIVDNLANSIYNSNGAKVSEEFLMLSMLPLTKDPIAKEISKLFYLAGLKIRENYGSSKEVFEKMAAQLGLKVDSRSKGSAEPALKLHFDELNSVRGFVDISSALFAGAVSSDKKHGVEMSQKLDKNHTYTVVLSPAQ
ncbi:MAG: hypothetical protein ACP5RF_02115 [Candidatus Micrarchaeia archaeon]